uniref:Uncharacterized protein n=1 Tax=Geospiza parvula TaxID=87175 RepID=A0A8U8BTC0_GEOPR
QIPIFTPKSPFFPKIPHFHPKSPQACSPWPPGHGHFRQRGPGGPGDPRPPFPGRVPPQLQRAGLRSDPRPPGPPERPPGPPERPSAPAPPRAPGGLPLLRGPPAVAAARRDFPCKEAALGAYAGAFAGLYVTLAWRGGGSRLAKPAAVLGFAAPPFLLGALRVAEHRNSWGGVLGGFLCGTAIAAFLVTCVVGNFQNQGGDLGWGAGTPRAPRAAPPKPPTPPGGDQRHPGASGGVPSGDLRDPKNREPQNQGTPKIGNPEFGGAWEKTWDRGIWGIFEIWDPKNWGILTFGIPKFWGWRNLGSPKLGNPGILDPKIWGILKFGIPKIEEF